MWRTRHVLEAANSVPLNVLGRTERGEALLAARAAKVPHVVARVAEAALLVPHLDDRGQRAVDAAAEADDAASKGVLRVDDQRAAHLAQRQRPVRFGVKAHRRTAGPHRRRGAVGDGAAVGTELGRVDGWLDGADEGAGDGDADGLDDGLEDGTELGEAEGTEDGRLNA